MKDGWGYGIAYIAIVGGAFVVWINLAKRDRDKNRKRDVSTIPRLCHYHTRQNKKNHITIVDDAGCDLCRLDEYQTL